MLYTKICTWSTRQCFQFMTSTSIFKHWRWDVHQIMSCAVGNLVCLKGFSENNELAFWFGSFVYKYHVSHIEWCRIRSQKQLKMSYVATQKLMQIPHHLSSETQDFALSFAGHGPFFLDWHFVVLVSFSKFPLFKDHALWRRRFTRPRLLQSYRHLAAFHGSNLIAWGLFNSLSIKWLKDCMPDDICSCRCRASIKPKILCSCICQFCHRELLNVNVAFGCTCCLNYGPFVWEVRQWHKARHQIKHCLLIAHTSQHSRAPSARTPHNFDNYY